MSKKAKNNSKKTEVHSFRDFKDILEEADETYKELIDLTMRIGGINFTPEYERDKRLIELYEQKRDKAFTYKLLEREFQLTKDPPEIMVTI